VHQEVALLERRQQRLSHQWQYGNRWRGCDWSACNEGEDRVDVDGRRELAELNPEADIWVTGVDR
jgi:hypothetical protein